MKNNKFNILWLLLLTLPLFSLAQKNTKGGEYYQITVYHFVNADQQKIIDNYLKEAYLPALHRQKINSVGVFTPISNDTASDKRLYVVFPIKSLQVADDIIATLEKDNEYLTRGKEYSDVVYNNPAYSRKENILLKSFPLAPAMTLPKLKGPSAERVYELRSYEGASEKIFLNKVKMFNEGGEIALFTRLNFNPVFYASVIAGSRMPNLMYMTSFENMSDRDAHWKTFSADPEWKTISGMPEYKNNVAKIDITLMRAAPYSDF